MHYFRTNWYKFQSKTKNSKHELIQLARNRKEKEALVRKSWSKKDIQEKGAKVKRGSTEKLPRYSTIESVVELEIQDDDVNKENEIDEERTDILLSNYQTFCNKRRLRRHHTQKNAIT